MWDGFSTRPPSEGRQLRGRVENPSHILEQVRLEALRRQRRAEEEALDAIAALLLQELQLLLGLHPLGDDFEVEAVGHGDDGADDGGVAAVGGDVADERLVELERVDGETLQVIE